MDEPRLASIVPYMFKYYRRNARKRQVEWALTRDEFKELILKPCVYCGNSPTSKTFNTWGGSGLTPKTSIEKVNGVDRIDSSKGYTQDNCATCCETCNRMKMTWTVSEFITHVRKIILFWGDK